MRHPWTQSFKLRKNLFGGPFEDYVWAIKGPSLGNLGDQQRMQDKPPVPKGYQYYPPILSPMIKI